ncbi:MAG TPA: cation acetate symporter [Planctomycetaceae bacterium]|nr:cation acetate symporter [Planctomycetaceae bacterium]
MTYDASALAVGIFCLFVAVTLGLSFYLGARAKSAAGYFAAGGGIHWFVNGIAFAGDYLSAASFLGICGMIAFYGYDGFLYSIGYLAGWVVALFVIAEPLKRMGRYTFADALDSKFNSRGIKLSAAISTLVVSIFYLIPQMVGAGALVKPLLGFPHAVGVMMVGAVVTLIVVTAGMVSTTYVQFLKGSLLVIFSAVLTVMILNRGLTVPESEQSSALRGRIHPERFEVEPTVEGMDGEDLPRDEQPLPSTGGWHGRPYFRLENKATGEIETWRKGETAGGETVSWRAQTVTVQPDGTKLVNGLRPAPADPATGKAKWDLVPVGHLSRLPGDLDQSGPLGPAEFFRTLQQSEVILWEKEKDVIKDDDGSVTTIYYPRPAKGSEVLRPGNLPAFKGIRSDKPTDKLNFLSLMLALFGGTASLPHILIRYYTVKDQASARKSTIVGIASIGFFYILTLYIGLGAMTSGSLDVTNSNMAAPLLARSFGEWLFAVISAIAFTTVLGTVSGLIIAASGAVAHDLLGSVFRLEMTDHEKIRIAKIASVVVGVIAIGLGILFEKMNVSYLVGWAFSIAASANLPALVMLLFWKGTTRQGITAAITVGMISSLAWILLSGDTFKEVYGLPPEQAPVPFSQPGIVTIPLGFAVLIGVSLLTRRK